MRKAVTLITGAEGEIGHALLARFARRDSPMITLDINPLDGSLASVVQREFSTRVVRFVADSGFFAAARRTK